MKRISAVLILFAITAAALGFVDADARGQVGVAVSEREASTLVGGDMCGDVPNFSCEWKTLFCLINSCPDGAACYCYVAGTGDYKPGTSDDVCQAAFGGDHSCWSLSSTRSQCAE